MSFTDYDIILVDNVAEEQSDFQLQEAFPELIFI